MRELEEAAKPTLIDLMRNRRAVWSLSHEERLVLGRWTAKTGYVLSYVSPVNLPVGSDHLHQLFRDQSGLPNLTAVFGMQYGYTRQYSYLVRHNWQTILPVSRQAEPRPLAASYKIAMQLQNLMLLVAHWPSPTAEFVVVQGAQVRIWPLTYPVMPSCAANLGSFSDSLTALAAFNDSLGIIEPPQPQSVD